MLGPIIIHPGYKSVVMNPYYPYALSSAPTLMALAPQTPMPQTPLP